MAIGIGISPFLGIKSSAVSLGTTIATTHYNRVIADGGVLPVGVAGLGSVLDSVISAYGVTDSTDFNTKVPVFLDPSYTGYKLGAGSGTTLGQAARTVYAISSSADVTQTTAASQPLLLAHSGVNYWWGSGVSGNDVTTPDAIANRFTGDIEYIVKCKFIKLLDNIGVSKYSATNLNCGFSWILNSSSFNAYYAIGSTAYQITFATSAFPTLNTDVFIKVIRNSSTGLVTASFSTNGTSYTTIGSLTGQTGTINGGSVPLCASTTTITGGNQGYTYRATISNSIGGTPVVDFNPASYNAATSQTAWTSATGEVWTINTGTATTGYKGVLVDRTILQGDGTTAYMQQSGSLGFTLNSANSFYFATKKFNKTNQFPFEYRKASSGNGILVRIGNNYANYREGQAYQATSFSNNLNLNLFNSVFQASNNRSANLNNGTAQSDSTAGTLSSDTVDNIGFFGFGSGVGASYNGNINSFLITKSADTTPQNTAMYNIIRSMNNNAF